MGRTGGDWPLAIVQMSGRSPPEVVKIFERSPHSKIVVDGDLDKLINRSRTHGLFGFVASSPLLSFPQNNRWPLSQCISSSPLNEMNPLLPCSRTTITEPTREAAPDTSRWDDDDKLTHTQVHNGRDG